MSVMKVDRMSHLNGFRPQVASSELSSVATVATNGGNRGGRCERVLVIVPPSAVRDSRAIQQARD